MRTWKDRRVVLGVCGGIAAFKAVLLLRALQRGGASVRVVMTETATRFVGPLTFEALSESPVGLDGDFLGIGSGRAMHIEWAREADLILVAPCTATTLARIAHGMADNLLSAIVLASRCPVLLVPSMHTAMWEAHATRQNLQALDPERFHVMPPECGDLASGDRGPGRFPEAEDILQEAAFALGPRDLAGRVLVVTAGPTREPMDPVRVLTNPSTGRMGIELARAALRRGAEVRLVLGPTEVAPPRGLAKAPLQVHRVTTCREMLEATDACLQGADGLLMAAAPADQAPASVEPTKRRKEDLPDLLALSRTPDILATLAPRTRDKVVLAFAAETGDLISAGSEKRSRKGATLLFANRVGNGQGFGAVANGGWLIRPEGPPEEVLPLPKEDLADLLLDRVKEYLPAGATS